MRFRHFAGAVVCCLTLALPAAAAGGRHSFEAKVTKSGSTFSCHVLLTQLGTNVVLADRKVDGVAGEVATAIWGKDEAGHSGTEYRLTCRVDEQRSLALIDLRVNRLQAGMVKSFSTFRSRVKPEETR
jgi:hypothetical protein